jgi:hypothetical protein
LQFAQRGVPRSIAPSLLRVPQDGHATIAMA